MTELLSRDVGGVRVITLNRPERLNAFTPTGYRELRIALQEADVESQVGVVVLEGGERAFSTGADLRFLREQDDIDAMKFEFDGLLKALVQLSKPLIAAAAGAVVGFGATLLLHCDVVLVASDARLRFPFVELGTAPEAGSSWLLPHTVGAQRAMELILSSRWVGAEEAVEMGLAARTVSPDDLRPSALNLAQQIVAAPSGAAVAAKALLRNASRRSVLEAVEREYTSAAELAATHGAAVQVRTPTE